MSGDEQRDETKTILGYAHLDGEIEYADTLPGSAQEIALGQIDEQRWSFDQSYRDAQVHRMNTKTMRAASGTEAGLPPVVKDRTKARFDLIPYGPLWKMAEVFTNGARKPGRVAHNWRKGTEWSDYFSAMMRHAALYQQGEDFEIDPDTGTRIDHLAAVMCCASILLEYQMFNLGTDDRFPAGHPAYKGEKTDADAKG